MISSFVNVLSNFRFFLEEQQQKNKIPFQKVVTMKKALLWWNDQQNTPMLSGDEQHKSHWHDQTILTISIHNWPWKVQPDAFLLLFLFAKWGLLAIFVGKRWPALMDLGSKDSFPTKKPGTNGKNQRNLNFLSQDANVVLCGSEPWCT